MMSPLAYFTLQIALVAGQLGILTPRVHVMSRYDRHPSGVAAAVVSYVIPCPLEPNCYQVRVMRETLDTADASTLRCVARHESTHIYLDHGNGAHSEAELSFFEAEVRAFMRLRWDQDSGCGLTGGPKP